MGIKSVIRLLDRRLTGGRFRRWFLRNAVLGGGWGDFMDEVEGLAADKTLLDIGAGEAGLRARFPRARYIAVDRGIGHSGWDYSKLDVVADARLLPFGNRTIDVVVCKQVLEHLPEPIALLREVKRLLRPGGWIALSTNQAWPQHQKPHDFFRFTSFGLRYCFEQAGLDINKMTPMGGAFSCALFHFSQTLAPHLWARGPRSTRFLSVLMRPIGWLFRLAMPLVSLLDRLDRTKDNTLGWYVLGYRPDEPPHGTAAETEQHKRK